MAKLPKRIIQKYGITKKAWSVFRGEKRTNNTGERRMAKRHKRMHRSSGIGSMAGFSPALYGAGYGVIRPFAAGIVPDFANGYGDNLVLGFAGWFLGKQGNGFMRESGKAILTVEGFLAATKASSTMSQDGF